MFNKSSCIATTVDVTQFIPVIINSARLCYAAWVSPRSSTNQIDKTFLGEIWFNQTTSKV
jgi:hypothetical protein